MKAPMVMTAECQCEHVDHFDDEGAPHDGTEGCHHTYGQEIDLERMTQVQTIFGTFTVCVDCARTHLSDPELLA